MARGPQTQPRLRVFVEIPDGDAGHVGFVAINDCIVSTAVNPVKAAVPPSMRSMRLQAVPPARGRGTPSTVAMSHIPVEDRWRAAVCRGVDALLEGREAYLPAGWPSRLLPSMKPVPITPSIACLNRFSS